MHVVLISIGEVLKFIQNSLGIPVLASFAANALQNVCHDCKQQVAHLFEGILEIIQTADTLGITNKSVIGLLTGN